MTTLCTESGRDDDDHETFTIIPKKLSDLNSFGQVVISLRPLQKKKFQPFLDAWMNKLRNIWARGYANLTQPHLMTLDSTSFFLRLPVEISWVENGLIFFWLKKFIEFLDWSTRRGAEKIVTFCYEIGIDGSRQDFWWLFFMLFLFAIEPIILKGICIGPRHLNF